MKINYLKSTLLIITTALLTTTVKAQKADTLKTKVDYKADGRHHSHRETFRDTRLIDGRRAASTWQWCGPANYPIRSP